MYFKVVFCNNPFTGLVILLALFWADLFVGLATTLAASTAIITAIVRKSRNLDLIHFYTSMFMLYAYF